MKLDGSPEGWLVGGRLGWSDGAVEGRSVGRCESNFSREVGRSVENPDGWSVGVSVGDCVGARLGLHEKTGTGVGFSVGTGDIMIGKVGDIDGLSVLHGKCPSHLSVARAGGRVRSAAERSSVRELVNIRWYGRGRQRRQARRN